MPVTALRSFASRVLPLRSRVLLKRYLTELNLRLGRYSSEHGEYNQLKRLIRKDFPPFIVDVGAYDGVVLSNSYPFTRMGWSGVMIEPHPLAYSLLTETYKNNRYVHCINKAVSNVQGVLPFFIGTGNGLTMTSTLCTDENQLMRERREGTAIVVQVDTLTNILRESGAPKDFSILLIDTEGMDYEVLESLDFNQYQPRIILTEEYILNVAKHNQKHQLLHDRGYALYSMIGCNTLWIRNEWVKCSVYGISQ